MSILTVRQLTAQIKDAVENGFPYVWVRGEVTNVSRPSSGHIYFSLKDENALLQAVWFKGSQKERETFDPLTGEVFEDGPRLSLAGTLRNGQQVICAGRLTVYAPRGGYQLVVELAQDSGEGQLHLALEALKRKLAEKGYFSLERKRPIPEHPHRVAVITAPSGAAIRDFLRLSGERGTGCEIRIHPVPVQGDDAPPRIAEALDDENRRGWADVLVLIRGGGSLQDLWAFNDERVADAVYRSRIPVVAGIGHEIDTSIADMVADLRAATPSHAAQLLWPERQWYAQLVDDLEAGLLEAAGRRLSQADQRLDTLGRALAWLSPERGLARLEERFGALARRLDFALEQKLERADARLRFPESPAMRNPVCWTPGWSKRRPWPAACGRRKRCGLGRSGGGWTRPLPVWKSALPGSWKGWSANWNATSCGSAGLTPKGRWSGAMPMLLRRTAISSAAFGMCSRAHP